MTFQPYNLAAQINDTNYGLGSQTSLLLNRAQTLELSCSVVGDDGLTVQTQAATVSLVDAFPSPSNPFQVRNQVAVSWAGTATNPYLSMNGNVVETTVLSNTIYATLSSTQTGSQIAYTFHSDNFTQDLTPIFIRPFAVPSPFATMSADLTSVTVTLSPITPSEIYDSYFFTVSYGSSALPITSTVTITPDDPITTVTITATGETFGHTETTVLPILYAPTPLLRGTFHDDSVTFSDVSILSSIFPNRSRTFKLDSELTILPVDVETSQMHVAELSSAGATYSAIITSSEAASYMTHLAYNLFIVPTFTAEDYLRFLASNSVSSILTPFTVTGVSVEDASSVAHYASSVTILDSLADVAENAVELSNDNVTSIVFTDSNYVPSFTISEYDTAANIIVYFPSIRISDTAETLSQNLSLYSPQIVEVSPNDPAPGDPLYTPIPLTFSQLFASQNGISLYPPNSFIVTATLEQVQSNLSLLNLPQLTTVTFEPSAVTQVELTTSDIVSYPHLVAMLPSNTIKLVLFDADSLSTILANISKILTIPSATVSVSQFKQIPLVDLPTFASIGISDTPLNLATAYNSGDLPNSAISSIVAFPYYSYLTPTPVFRTPTNVTTTSFTIDVTLPPSNYDSYTWSITCNGQSFTTFPVTVTGLTADTSYNVTAYATGQTYGYVGAMSTTTVKTANLVINAPSQSTNQIVFSWTGIATNPYVTLNGVTIPTAVSTNALSATLAASQQNETLQFTFHADEVTHPFTSVTILPFNVPTPTLSVTDVTPTSFVVQADVAAGTYDGYTWSIECGGQTSTSFPFTVTGLGFQTLYAVTAVATGSTYNYSATTAQSFYSSAVALTVAQDANVLTFSTNTSLTFTVQDAVGNVVSNPLTMTDEAYVGITTFSLYAPTFVASKTLVVAPFRVPVPVLTISDVTPLFLTLDITTVDATKYVPFEYSLTIDGVSFPVSSQAMKISNLYVGSHTFVLTATSTMTPLSASTTSSIHWYSLNATSPSNVKVFSGMFAVHNDSIKGVFETIHGTLQPMNLLVPPGVYVQGWKQFNRTGIVLTNATFSPSLAMFSNGDELTSNIGTVETRASVPGVAFQIVKLSTSPYGSPLISNICFPRGTLVTCDQGTMPIQSITKRNTFGGHFVEAVTETITTDDYLIEFTTNSFAPGVPFAPLKMSKDHVVQWNGFKKAADVHHGVKIPYRGEILYNVLLDVHGLMNVQGLACETLHPSNSVAVYYRANDKQSVNEWNKHVLENKIYV